MFEKSRCTFLIEFSPPASPAAGANIDAKLKDLQQFPIFQYRGILGGYSVHLEILTFMLSGTPFREGPPPKKQKKSEPALHHSYEHFFWSGGS